MSLFTTTQALEVQHARVHGRLWDEDQPPSGAASGGPLAVCQFQRRLFRAPPRLRASWHVAGSLASRMTHES